MKRFTYTLLIIFAATCFVTAQTQNLFEAPDNLLGGLNEETTGVVGAIGGTVDVSTLGAATYTIPIQVPEGIHGIQPNLSIVYNSQSGNNMLGWGWSFTGISAISRGKCTVYHDGGMSGIQFNQNIYNLDGQRLMLVDDTHFEYSEYHTEIDDMSKIVCHRDENHLPDYFKVWLSNGLIAYYGNSSNSKIKLQEAEHTCIWLLSRVEDRDGNYMEYHYNSGGSHYYLDWIRYTGNTNANLNPVFKIQFNYEKREPETVETMFIVKNDLNMSKLLKSIGVYKRGAGTDWDLIQSYSFNYMNRNSLFGEYIYDRLESIDFACFDNNTNPATEYHYNPTIIKWGESPEINNGNSNPPFTEGYKTVIDFHGGSSNREQKYVGDFNGDGLSDFIVTNEDGHNIIIKQFINTGNTKTETTPGGISFEMREIQVTDIDHTRVIWVYTCDFNGDGFDDFLLLYDRASSSPYGEKIVRAYKSIVENGNYRTEQIFHQIIGPGSTPTAVFTGDFKGRGKSDIIIQVSSNSLGTLRYPFNYLEYTENSSGCTLRLSQAKIMEGNQIVEQWSFPVFRYATGDFNNDGRTEIWAADENGAGCFYRIEGSAEDHYSNFPFLAFSDGHTTPFVGDFNGDGVSDMLFHNGGHWYVKICAAPETYGYFTYDLTHELYPVSAYIPPYFGYDKDNRQNNMTYYLDIADINGDGKSDVIVINIYGEAHIFYGPIIPGYRSSRTPKAHFAYRETFNASSAGLSNNMFTRCVGNFFGQENLAIMDDAIVFSKPPLSTYYGVTSITDGMGNRTEFEFGYLTENPHEGADNIYTLTRDGEDRTRDIFAVALPIKAVKRITSSNIADPYNVKSISEYTYSGILAHRKGKGILGLTKSTTESYIEGAPFHNYVERLFSSTAMGEHCALTPTEERTFLKKEANGHLKLITETTFSYDKHVHTMNNKVFMPLLTDQITDHYDIYHQINGIPVFVKREITQNIIESWRHDCIATTSCHSGTTTNQNISNYEDCEFQGRWSCLENEVSVEDWLIQRPINISEGYDGCFLYEKIFHYNEELNKPYQIKEILIIPAQHYSSELATCTSYTYDIVGNIKTETTFGVNDHTLQPRKTEFFYSGHRLLSIKREWLDENEGLFYDTEYEYDPYFDLVTKETNCRGQITIFNRDPLGINTSITSPNGITTRTQTGWLHDNSGYYEWSYTQGSPPILTTYDLTGRVKRVETYGFNENQLIVKNYIYNSLGQLKLEEDPHLDNENQVAETIYTYDDYGVLRKTQYPNGNIVRIKRDDNNCFIIITETTACEGGINIIHSTVQETNAIGQVVTCWDENNNTVSYTYNTDGMLKTAMVNNDPSTTIELWYDEARNRIRLHDPDYCGNGNDLISTYDAFGQLRTTTTPKGDITVYDYDAFGRTISRTEGTDIAIWEYYDRNPLFKGLLKEVRHNETQEKTVYTYDPITRRLTSVSETINGITHSPTSYTYNNLGQIENIQYPTGIRIEKSYSSTGHLVQITDNVGENLWTTIAKNGQGQITEFSTGCGIHSLKGVYQYYDDTHLLKSQLITNQSNAKIHHFNYNYDKFSNLAGRSTVLHGGLKETFYYDALNRLTQSNVTNQNMVYTSDIVYDNNDFGCINTKTAAYVGGPAFSNAQYGIYGRPHAVRTAEMNIEVFPTSKLQTDYNRFDKLSQIIQYNDDGSIDRSLSYMYGYNHQRIYMAENEGQTIVRTKTYLGNCEYIYDNGNNRAFTYLLGPLGVFGVYEHTIENGQVTNSTLHYIFTDHLGSFTTITNDKGVVEQELSYDAWGNLRDPETWSNTFEGTPMLDRGFTGHEHLYAFGLINMNGRMYDPVLGSFLSPDNYIQNPENSQSFNRYAYCLNNPLRYVDPSGEFLTWSINQYGLSIGLNFTPAGYPLGFGINASWANGGSIGVYGEIGYRVGGSGLGAGFGVQQSLDFSFNGFTTTTSSIFAYGSIGFITASASGQYMYCLSNKQGAFGWSVGISASINPTMPYSEYGQSFGLGIGISYGSGGFGFGINGYYQGLSLQDKLDIMVAKHNEELQAIGDGDVVSILVGNRKNLKNEPNLYSSGGLLYTYDADGEVRYARGAAVKGTTIEDYQHPEETYISDNKIYISKRTVRQLWRGNVSAMETLRHEWFHCVDYRSGLYNNLVNSYGGKIASDIMEYRAYMFNYEHTGNSYYFNKAMNHGNRAFLNAFMIKYVK